MSPRTGRPPSADPKIHSTRIRYGTEDKKKLQYCAEKLNITEAEVIRLGVDKIYKELTKDE